MYAGVAPKPWAISVLAEGGNLSRGKTGGAGGLRLSDVVVWQVPVQPARPATKMAANTSSRNHDEITTKP